MSIQSVSPPFSLSPRGRRQAALAIALTSVLGLAVLIHHPGIGEAKTGQQLLAQLSALAQIDALVHGALIVLLGTMGAGLTALALLPELRRAPALAGAAAWWLGWLGLTAAALLDGFVSPQLALRVNDAVLARGAEQAAPQIGMATMVLALCAVAIQVLTRAALVAMGAAMLAWACAAWRAARACALAGVLLGLATAGIALGFGGWLGPANLPALFGLLAAWNGVAVVLLCRGAGAAAAGEGGVV